MHSSHAAFIFREEHRRELLEFAEQQRLTRMACTSRTRTPPSTAIATAIRTGVRWLTTAWPFALRERPPRRPASLAVDAPIPPSGG